MFFCHFSPVGKSTILPEQSCLPITVGDVTCLESIYSTASLLGRYSSIFADQVG